MSAIADYVRTALLIDDRISDESGPLEELEEEGVNELGSEPAPGLEVPIGRGQTPIYWRSLVDAFLDQNVVCSVVEPSEDTDVANLAVRGAQIADLLIIDWLIFGEEYQALGAITAIAESDSDRLRVIAVFTGEEDLIGVAERLRCEGKFKTFVNRHGLSNEFILKRGCTIVLVFNKPSVKASGEAEERRVEYSELPIRIREDLEAIFDGLMPRFAFQATNVLRDSITRVLTQFSAELDTAALIHRALLPQPEDARVQFIRLLVSEFEQALIEQRVDSVWERNRVKEFLSESSLIAAPDAFADILRRSPNTPRDMVGLQSEDLVIAAIARGVYESGMKNWKVREKATEVSKVFGDDVRSQELLATLMSGSEFGTDALSLELGVVVQDLESGSYLLCIQPLCDSVNLKMDCRQAFPFMPFRDEQSGSPVVMIRDGDGDVIKVYFESKPHKLMMQEFLPDDSGRVVATPRGKEPSEWVFASGNRSYRAVARLRSEVAAQAVQEFVAKASRPGVDIFELLRLDGM